MEWSRESLLYLVRLQCNRYVRHPAGSLVLASGVSRLPAVSATAHALSVGACAINCSGIAVDHSAAGRLYNNVAIPVPIRADLMIRRVRTHDLSVSAAPVFTQLWRRGVKTLGASHAPGTSALIHLENKCAFGPQMPAPTQSCPPSAPSTTSCSSNVCTSSSTDYSNRRKRRKVTSAGAFKVGQQVEVTSQRQHLVHQKAVVVYGGHGYYTVDIPSIGKIILRSSCLRPAATETTALSSVAKSTPLPGKAIPKFACSRSKEDADDHPSVSDATLLLRLAEGH